MKLIYFLFKFSTNIKQNMELWFYVLIWTSWTAFFFLTYWQVDFHYKRNITIIFFSFVRKIWSLVWFFFLVMSMKSWYVKFHDITKFFFIIYSIFSFYLYIFLFLLFVVLPASINKNNYFSFYQIFKRYLFEYSCVFMRNEGNIKNKYHFFTKVILTLNWCII